jgi:DNA polymerase III sliding clamp (beta) subunit (PCNA family)
VERNELLKAATATIIGVDKSGSPTGMDFLIFDKDWMRSFNDTLSISYQIQTGVEGAVKAHEFVKVLEKMEGETIKMTSEEGKILIKDSKTTLKMTKMEKDILKHLREQLISLNTNDLKWKPIPDGFSEGLEICLFSAGTEPELGQMAGVAFKGESIMTTDRFRITIATMKSPITSDFILPTETVGSLVQFGDELKKISVTDSWIHFKDKGGLIISVRRLLGEYPYDKMTEIFEKNFKKGNKIKTYTLPKGIERSIERTEVLAGSEKGGGMDLISLKRVGKNLIVRGKKEIGEVEDKIEWKDGKDFPEELELKLSPEFLEKIVKISKTFQLGPNNTTVLFKGENFKHLMVAEIGGK